MLEEQRQLPRLQVSFNSPVILGFSIICLIALVLSAVTGGAVNNLLFSVYRSSLLDPLTYVRFIGHIFGHANWEHFIGNIMLILVVGPLFRRKIWFLGYSIGGIFYSFNNRFSKLHILSKCSVAWSKRCCFCINIAFIIYKHKRRKHTAYIYTCCSYLFGTAGLSGDFCKG